MVAVSTVSSHLVSIAAVKLCFMTVSKIFIENLEELGKTRLKSSGQKWPLWSPDSVLYAGRRKLSVPCRVNYSAPCSLCVPSVRPGLPELVCSPWPLLSALAVLLEQRNKSTATLPALATLPQLSKTIHVAGFLTSSHPHPWRHSCSPNFLVNSTTETAWTATSLLWTIFL